MITKKIIPLMTICLITIGIISCDVSGDYNYDFKQGDSLAIVGSADVVIPQDATTADTTDVTQITESYYSKAFTINKEYAWTVSEGAQKDSVYRQGEYMDVTFTEPGTYTIGVDDGEYQGSLDVTVTRAPNDN